MYGCESWTIKKAECQRIDAVVLEKTLESPLDCKEVKPINHKGNHSCIFIGRTDAEAETPVLATWCEELTPWRRLWCWERLKAGGEGDDKGWDGWMASLTRWTWIWASSGSWWWTGKPGVLQSMGLQRTQLSEWTEPNCTKLRVKMESFRGPVSPRPSHLRILSLPHSPEFLCSTPDRGTVKSWGELKGWCVQEMEVGDCSLSCLIVTVSISSKFQINH